MYVCTCMCVWSSQSTSFPLNLAFLPTSVGLSSLSAQLHFTWLHSPLSLSLFLPLLTRFILLGLNSFLVEAPEYLILQIEAEKERRQERCKVRPEEEEERRRKSNYLQSTNFSLRSMLSTAYVYIYCILYTVSTEYSTRDIGTHTHTVEINYFTTLLCLLFWRRRRRRRKKKP